MTSLLKEPDEKKTISNVRNFLNKEFPRLMTKSRTSLSDIQAVTISDMPSVKSIRNSNEDKITSVITAKEAVDETIWAIESCPSVYRAILWLRYIEELKDSAIMERLIFSQSRYYELKNSAMLWFADGFEEYYDLHVYKSEF